MVARTIHLNRAENNSSFTASICKAHSIPIVDNPQCCCPVLGLLVLWYYLAVVGRISEACVNAFNAHAFLIPMLNRPYIELGSVIQPFIAYRDSVCSIVCVLLVVLIVASLPHSSVDISDRVACPLCSLLQTGRTRSAFSASSVDKAILVDGFNLSTSSTSAHHKLKRIRSVLNNPITEFLTNNIFVFHNQIILRCCQQYKCNSNYKNLNLTSVNMTDKEKTNVRHL